MSWRDKVFIDGLRIEGRLRPINEQTVDALVESMRRLGQLQPIIVFSPDESTVILVAGAHRVEAAKRLGWDDLDALFVTGDQVDLELLEIAETLHRAELTALERSIQIARWAELTAAKVGQVDPPRGGAQPKEKGIRKVAADLGLERKDVERAVKVASISEEAKQAARDAGIDDNRTALLAVAKETTAAAQVAKVAEISAAKSPPLVPEAAKPDTRADTQLIGAVKRFAEFCKANKPEIVAPGILPAEESELCELAETIEGRLDHLVSIAPRDAGVWLVTIMRHIMVAKSTLSAGDRAQLHEWLVPVIDGLVEPEVVKQAPALDQPIEVKSAEIIPPVPATTHSDEYPDLPAFLDRRLDAEQASAREGAAA